MIEASHRRDRSSRSGVCKGQWRTATDTRQVAVLADAPWVAHHEHMRRSQPRLVLRSKNQLWGGVASGVLLAVFGIVGALQAGYLAAEITEAAVALACGATLIGLTVRAAVIVDETGVTIRNPLGRTARIHWVTSPPSRSGATSCFTPCA